MAASLDEAGRYGIRRDETSGPGEPRTENLDGLFFGLGRATAAERRVLEADPGIMDLLEGGEVADGCFFLLLLASTPLFLRLYCLAQGAGRCRRPERPAVLGG